MARRAPAGVPPLLSVGADRLALARDPGRCGGSKLPLLSRSVLLHPGDRGLLRARFRDPARDLRAPPDPPLRHTLAGADLFLRQDRDSGRHPPRSSRGPRPVRLLEGGDSVAVCPQRPPIPRGRSSGPSARPALGVRDPPPLLLLFLASLRRRHGLRAVLRKARNGKFGGAGRLPRPVGVGIMLAGIVAPRPTQASNRLTLPV